MKRKSLSVLASVGLAVLLGGPSLAPAATAPSLGVASPYGVVSSTFTNTVAGTTINGDVCYTTGPFVAPTINGSTACVAGLGGAQDSALAILNSTIQNCQYLGTAVELSGVTIGANPPGTIPPGCYYSSGAMDIVANGIVTLSGDGVYVFRPGGALTTGADSRIVLAGACADNVFWAPVEATTLGARTTFVGNIIDAAGITIGAGTTLTGRALAFGGTVTTNTSTISVPPTCSVPPVLVPPTILKSFIPTDNGPGGVSRLVITLTNSNTAAAAITTAFTDTLPSGLVIAATPNASTTCTGSGAVVATPGGSTVTLPATYSIPGSGSCTVIADVTGAVAGTYTNTIAAGTLQTNNGNNATPASAILTVDATIPPAPPLPPGVIPVPTLPGWAIIMLTALLALAGFAAMRRRAM